MWRLASSSTLRPAAGRLRRVAPPRWGASLRASTAVDSAVDWQARYLEKDRAHSALAEANAALAEALAEANAANQQKLIETFSEFSKTQRETFSDYSKRQDERLEQLMSLTNECNAIKHTLQQERAAWLEKHQPLELRRIVETIVRLSAGTTVKDRLKNYMRCDDRLVLLDKFKKEPTIYRKLQRTSAWKEAWKKSQRDKKEKRYDDVDFDDWERTALPDAADEFLYGVYERLCDYVHEQAVNRRTIVLPAHGFEEAITLALYHLFDHAGFPVKIHDDCPVPI